MQMPYQVYVTGRIEGDFTGDTNRSATYVSFVTTVVPNLLKLRFRVIFSDNKSNMRFIFLIVLFSIPSSFAAETDPMERRDRAYDSSAWLALLHADASGRSRVDDPDFFLAGPNHSQGELTENLRNFNQTPTNYCCRFPARAHWMQSTWGQGTQNSPPHDPGTFITCPELEAALDKLKPDTAVVMFASEYLGNPSSAFGHTFLVFERAGRSRLLSQAVSYAARVDTRSAGNAWKGLTGQLPGQYQILPTFEKVKEYNDLAQRDIWEYELDLDPAEVRQLFRHVWELEGIRSDYWFLDENCAFNLLQLLDVARPAPTHAQSLSQQASKFTVLPGDVISLLQRSGLVRKRTFRPALARDIAAGLKASSAQGRRDALKLARGEVEAERVQERSALETAGLILQAWKGSKRIEPESFDLRYNAILARRSELGPSPAEENKAGRDPADRPPIPPDEMPRSRLLGLSGGLIEGTPDNGERADKNFAELQFRLLGHDVLDRPELGQGSQLELGHLRLRAFEEEIKIEELTLLELLSVSPHEPVFQRKSWQFRAGMERFHPSASDQADALLGLLEGSVGRATGPFYVLAGAELRTDLHNEALLGPELTLGAFTVAPGRGLRSHLSASLAYHVGTRSDWHPELHWNSRFRLAPRLDLTFDAAIRSERVREVRGGFAWNW